MIDFIEDLSRDGDPGRLARPLRRRHRPGRAAGRSRATPATRPASTPTSGTPPPPKLDLTRSERERLSAIDVRTPDQRNLNRNWTPSHAALLEAAARDPRVNRIFVTAPVKLRMCADAGRGDAAWLRKIRPWWGHNDHFHVRLNCPAGARGCTDPDPIPRRRRLQGRRLVGHRRAAAARPERAEDPAEAAAPPRRPAAAVHRGAAGAMRLAARGGRSPPARWRPAPTARRLVLDSGSPGRRAGSSSAASRASSVSADGTDFVAITDKAGWVVGSFERRDGRLRGAPHPAARPPARHRRARPHRPRHRRRGPGCRRATAGPTSPSRASTGSAATTRSADPPPGSRATRTSGGSRRTPASRPWRSTRAAPSTPSRSAPAP